MESYVFREAAGVSEDAPVLFLFHGTGGDENQFFGLGRQLMTEARLVAPRGDVLERGMPRYFRRTGEGVYDMDDLALRTRKMAAFVRARLDAGPHGTVLGMGYSNGANILASVMMQHPDLFAGAALLHPLIPFEPSVAPNLDGLRVLITAGRNDPICPAPRTEWLAQWLEERDAEVTLSWHESGHELRDGELEAVAKFTAGFWAKA